MLDTRFTTEGIRYTGSKRQIIPRIINMIQTKCTDVHTVLDACAGTTRVSQALRKNGFSVTVSDLALMGKKFAFPFVFTVELPHDIKDQTGAPEVEVITG